MYLTAIVKPTHKCNLRCAYCYVEATAERGTMSDETLRNTIKKLLEFDCSKDGHVNFIWHGGEPLLAGKRFFRKVVTYQDEFRNGKNVSNSVQSNGTLLNESLADFFLKHNFTVGMSLDGPQEINDLTRRFADGSSCFDAVMKGHSIARKKEIGRGVIAILTRLNVGKIEEIYSFFASNDINLKVSPLINAGRGRSEFSKLALSPQEYGTAMIRLFNLWFNDLSSSITVSPFDSILASFVTKRPTSCDFIGQCQSEYLSIGPTGAIYPCGRFDGLPQFCLGNINVDPVKAIIASPVKRKMLERCVEKLIECANCGFQIYCNGGCLHNAWTAYGDFMRRDFYCEAYQMIFSHVKCVLDSELKKVAKCIQE